MSDPMLAQCGSCYDKFYVERLGLSCAKCHSHHVFWWPPMRACRVCNERDRGETVVIQHRGPFIWEAFCRECDTQGPTAWTRFGAARGWNAMMQLVRGHR